MRYLKLALMPVNPLPILSEFGNDLLMHGSGLQCWSFPTPSAMAWPLFPHAPISRTCLNPCRYILARPEMRDAPHTTPHPPQSEPSTF